MWNFLLDTTSSDGIPGGIAKSIEFDGFSFLVGIVVGTLVTLAIVGIVKYIKFVQKENRELEERSSSQKSE